MLAARLFSAGKLGVYYSCVEIKLREYRSPRVYYCAPKEIFFIPCVFFLSRRANYKRETVTRTLLSL